MPQKRWYIKHGYFILWKQWKVTYFLFQNVSPSAITVIPTTDYKEGYCSLVSQKIEPFKWRVQDNLSFLLGEVGVISLVSWETPLHVFLVLAMDMNKTNIDAKSNQSLDEVLYAFLL